MAASIASITVAAFVLAAGCSQPRTQGADAASGDAGGSAGAAGSAGAGAAAGSGGGGGSGAAGGCPAGPPVVDAPDGWVEYPLFDCRYRIFAPPTRDQLPPGPTWKACASPGPDLTACREMTIDWKTAGTNATGGAPEAYVDAQGRVVLQFRHIYEDARTGRYASMVLVAEADGPVRQALFTPYAPPTGTGFWLLPGGVAPGKSLWKVIDWDTDPEGRSAIGGADDLLVPGVLFPLATTRGGVWAGSNWVVETLSSSFRVIDWNMGTPVATVYQGIDASIPRFVGDVLFFSLPVPPDSGLWMWTRDGGAVRLLGYTNDPTRAVGGLGTDGTDMVWLAGEGLTTQSSVYATRAVYSAPFTTDPAALQPRRLRAWDGLLIDDVYPPAVGCGYAALFAGTETENLLIVVRLGDGAAWKIRSPGTTLGDGWGVPLAVTCSEVFAAAGLNIVRFPFSSLGAPVP